MKPTKGQRVGILGAGQLALMLAEAAAPLGISVLCAGQPGDCAEQAVKVVPVNLDDAREVASFAESVDLVTIESENIDADVLRGLRLYPNARAVGIAQDRLLEKQFFHACGIKTAPFEQVDSADDLTRAALRMGLPAILKTRRMGYDGKGQVRLRSLDQVSEAWAEVAGVPCVLEGMVQFSAEVSLIAARGSSGDIVFYPLVENHHRDGILRVSKAPFVDGDLQRLAEQYMRVVMEKLEYVGVLAIEFFISEHALLANEMAPRVHNSGHWTIEGAATSQFENHLRAICGLELGSTESRPTVMLNCIGSMPKEAETKQYAGLSRHDYGKESRPGRKVGHLTFAAEDAEAIEVWRRRLEE